MDLLIEHQTSLVLFENPLKNNFLILTERKIFEIMSCNLAFHFALEVRSTGYCINLRKNSFICKNLSFTIDEKILNKS